MYLFDPGAEGSCLYNFLSLNCRTGTIENMLRTGSKKKKMNSEGQKPWLPWSCRHACRGLSSACGPGRRGAERRRGDADVSRQTCLLLHDSPSAAAALSLVGCHHAWGQHGVPGAGGVCPTRCLPGEGCGVRAKSAAGLVIAGWEGSSTCILAGPIFPWLCCITLV